MANNSKYLIDNKYFSSIDTQEKAYFLGLLYADGCVSQLPRHTVSISLKATDSSILEAMKIALKSEHPIKYYECRGGQYTHFTFNDTLIHRDLIKHGCVPAKSKILLFPETLLINDKLLSSFIAGYFDGDGSIVLSNSKTQHKNRIKQTNITRIDCGITSSKLFINKLKEILEQRLNIKCGIKIPHANKQDGNTLTLTINGAKQIQTFLDYIYKNQPVKMERKYNTYLKLCEYTLYQQSKHCLVCSKKEYADGLCQRHYKLKITGKTIDKCIICFNTSISQVVNLCKKHFDSYTYYNKQNKEQEFLNKNNITKQDLIKL